MKCQFLAGCDKEAARKLKTKDYCPEHYSQLQFMLRTIKELVKEKGRNEFTNVEVYKKLGYDQV